MWCRNMLPLPPKRSTGHSLSPFPPQDDLLVIRVYLQSFDISKMISYSVKNSHTIIYSMQCINTFCSMVVIIIVNSVFNWCRFTMCEKPGDVSLRHYTVARKNRILISLWSHCLHCSEYLTLCEATYIVDL